MTKKTIGTIGYVGYAVASSEKITEAIEGLLAVSSKEARQLNEILNDEDSKAITISTSTLKENPMSGQEKRRERRKDKQKNHGK